MGRRHFMKLCAALTAAGSASPSERALLDPPAIDVTAEASSTSMDGVAGLIQQPIKPGEKFVYRFTPLDAGTFWYHSYLNAYEQVIGRRFTDEIPWL